MQGTYIQVLDDLGPVNAAYFSPPVYVAQYRGIFVATIGSDGVNVIDAGAAWSAFAQYQGTRPGEYVNSDQIPVGFPASQIALYDLDSDGPVITFGVRETAAGAWFQKTYDNNLPSPTSYLLFSATPFGAGVRARIRCWGIPKT